MAGEYISSIIQHGKLHHEEGGLQCRNVKNKVAFIFVITSVVWIHVHTDYFYDCRKLEMQVDRHESHNFLCTWQRIGQHFDEGAYT